MCYGAPGDPRVKLKLGAQSPPILQDEVGTRGPGEAVPARAPGGLSARDLPAVPFVLLYLFGVQCGNAPAQPVRREAHLGPGPPLRR